MKRVIEVQRGQLERHRWNQFVDRHPDGWWFHRSEWLDYSLAYTPSAVDRSVAFLDDHYQVCGIRPAIDENGCVAMGGEPCAGPLGVSGVDSLPPRFSLRWTHPSPDASLTIAELERQESVRRSGWSTVVLPLVGRSGAEMWGDLRKSYRTVIRHAEQQYRVRVGGMEYWGAYLRCHRVAATRPRPSATYDHQWAMGRNGHTRIAVALDESGCCVAAVWALVYRGRAYYASGPSWIRGVQHAVLWAMVKHLAAEGVEEFEIGWTGQPEGSSDVEFFKRGFGRLRESVVVLSRGKA